MPCSKRRAPPGKRSHRQYGNARATLSRGGVQANDYIFICMHSIESASVIWSRPFASSATAMTVLRISPSHFRFYVYHTWMEGSRSVPEQFTLVDSLLILIK